MNWTNLLLASALCLSFVIQSSAVEKRDHNKKPYRLVCYFGSWARYHKAEPFVIEDINYDMCTHINYGFAKLNESNYIIEAFDPTLDTDVWKAYERFIGLRKKNPNLTLMISLGGWWEGSEKYSDMAAVPERRKRFVDSVIQFLGKHGFDGLDFDWEFPANRGGGTEDRDNYITILTELREAFEPHGYLLTAALSPGKDKIDRAYVIPKVNELLDFANVMTYDYHGGFDDYLGHNAPLYARPEETDNYNVNFTVNYYIELGLQKKKMVMGLPFYGRGWTLESKDKVHVHDPAKGMSPAAYISGEAGIMGYNELCLFEEKAKPGEWHNFDDKYYKAPFAYNDTIFMSYDNVNSLECKVSFLKHMGLSGGMVWSLEFDDFKGRCGSGHKYPLLTKVHAMLNGDEKDNYQCRFSQPVTSPPTIATTPSTPRPTSPPTTPSTPRPTSPPTTPSTPRPTSPPTTPSTPRPTSPPTTPTTARITVPATAETHTGTPLVTKHIDGHTVSCYKQGYMPHPTDRHKYIDCVYIGEGPNKGWQVNIMECAPGTRWFQPALTCLADN